MKKKILFILLCLFIGINNLYAVSSSDVNYDIDDYIVSSQIDIAGNLNVKEVLKIDGTYNGYIRDILYKNSNLDKYKNDEIDFEHSYIYNGDGIVLTKVGRISYDKNDLDFDIFDYSIEEFSECTDSQKCYVKSDITDGISIKMYNETIKSSTHFYIEYTVENVVVNHEDVSELYYTFVGDGFEDYINQYKLRVYLPSKTTSELKVWAHGPLHGSIEKIYDNETNESIGANVYINGLSSHTPLDVRMTFPKDLIAAKIEGISKETNIEALDKILEVEQYRADEANRAREKARKKQDLMNALALIYLCLTGVIFVYVLIKYDIEYKNEYEDEYNRELIEDYDVTVIEYLFKKDITEKAFSTSILNLIYKKKIKVEKIESKKKDYKLILVDSEGLSKAETKLVDILFHKAGSNNELILSNLKKYAKKVTGTSSKLLSDFDSWKNIVKDDAIKENFFEESVKIKVLGVLYSIGGFLLGVMFINNFVNGKINLAVFAVSIVFMIYVLSFTKRSRKGNLHYHKWKAFRKFLKDFGRFDEKELPEVILWEKYLVYANILGVADKLSEEMRVKFNEYYVNDTDFTFTDFLIYNEINRSINKSITTSMQTAKSEQSKAIAASAASSGGGGGGGFSSGGGFGGGGGGGHGF